MQRALAFDSGEKQSGNADGSARGGGWRSIRNHCPQSSHADVGASVDTARVATVHM